MMRVNKLKLGNIMFIKKKKCVIIISLIFIAIFISIMFLISLQIKENKLRAQEIHNNMLGTSFYSKTKDDDGFYNNYTSNNLKSYEFYWLTTDETLYIFNKNGSVQYNSSFDMTALAYPKGVNPPSGTHNNFENNYDEFSVYISLSGNIYLSFSDTPKKSDYELIVGTDNIPSSIKCKKLNGDYILLEKQ